MRVLMLNYEFPPLGGGAGHAMACMLRKFAAWPDLIIDVVTSSAGAAREERMADNITVRCLDIGKRGGRHYQTMRDLLAYALKARRAARRLVADRRYDVCHAFFGIPCGWIARGLDLPYIVSLRGSDVPFYNERFRLLDRLLFARMSRGIWREAAFVVANSAGLRALALRTSPEQDIQVIPNGVDTDEFRPRPGGHEGLRVLCVARLIARKRVDVLIRAVAELRDQDVRLTLAGEGNQEQALRALAIECGAGEKVRFAGNVPRDSMPALYQENDVFVLPSANEGMSNAALEAMACGLPIVMTDTGGAQELLCDAEDGFLVGKGSVREVAQALHRYLDDPGLVCGHGARSRQIAEGLSWGQVAGKYAELYARAAGGRGG